MRICEYKNLGLIPYAEAHELQQETSARRKADEIPDTFFLLEHPHVITLGRAANKANVLIDEVGRKQAGVELFETGRGGDVTYHGPGQLVGYPIISLMPDACDVRKYVRNLEEVLIRSLADFDIEADRKDGLTGVWVRDEKIAAIGVRVSRWVTMHGFALNVSCDLSYFHLIVPCGITSYGITSLEKILNREISITDVVESVSYQFGKVFNRQMIHRE